MNDVFFFQKAGFIGCWDQLALQIELDFFRGEVLRSSCLGIQVLALYGGTDFDNFAYFLAVSDVNLDGFGHTSC